MTSMERSQARPPRKDFSPFAKNRHCIAARSYEQPTIASKSRSPSPYTKRRMCELSEDNKQRLAHLNLGPYEFKKEIDNKPPFVVRHIEKSSFLNDTHLFSCSPKQMSRANWSATFHDNSLLGSYRPKNAKMIPAFYRSNFDDYHSFDECLVSDPTDRPFHAKLLVTHSAPSSVQKETPSPILIRSSLRERFKHDPSMPTNGEEIHARVKTLLRTHGARQRLTFNSSTLWADDIEKRKDGLYRDSSSDSELEDKSLFKHNASFQMDNDKYGSHYSTAYKGKNHRAVFQESLGKIYKNMYENASDTGSRRKLHHIQ